MTLAGSVILLLLGTGPAAGQAPGPSSSAGPSRERAGPAERSGEGAARPHDEEEDEDVTSATGHEAGSTAGSAADAWLLRTLHADDVALVGERGRARRVLGALNAARYDQRLTALHGRQGDDARNRLVEAWYRRFAAVGGPQRVDPPSACRLQERGLREAMAGAAGSVAASRLNAARDEAGRCLEKLQASLLAARSSGEELDAILAEAQALLASSTTPVLGGR